MSHFTVSETVLGAPTNGPRRGGSLSVEYRNVNFRVHARTHLHTTGNLFSK